MNFHHFFAGFSVAISLNCFFDFCLFSFPLEIPHVLMFNADDLNVLLNDLIHFVITTIDWSPSLTLNFDPRESVSSNKQTWFSIFGTSDFHLFANFIVIEHWFSSQCFDHNCFWYDDNDFFWFLISVKMSALTLTQICIVETVI